MISIRAPFAIRNNVDSIWYGTTWTDLDVDRADFTVNNNVRVYEQIDEETSVNQLEASAHQLIITGHITADSEIIGTGVFKKAKNLILAGRQWYVNLYAGESGFPEITWNNSTWDFLIQKLMIIDTSVAGDSVINYQMSVILAHD